MEEKNKMMWKCQYEETPHQVHRFVVDSNVRERQCDSIGVRSKIWYRSLPLREPARVTFSKGAFGGATAAAAAAAGVAGVELSGYVC